MCSVGAVLWLSKVEMGLGTGVGAEAHLCAPGTQTGCPNFLQPYLPRAWFHPGSQSLETSQDAGKHCHSSDLKQADTR